MSREEAELVKMFPIKLFPKQIAVSIAVMFRRAVPPIIRTNSEVQAAGEAELKRRFPNG